MQRGTGRPQAEPVVMLGGEDKHLEAHVVQGRHPLLRVEIRGIKQRGVFRPVSPPAAGEGVYAKVDEGG